MKEALRRRFAPPFEPEKNILSSSGSSDLVASKFSSATPFEKNNSTNQPAIMGLPSDIPTATSIVGEDVPLNTSISDISSPLEQQAGVPEQISIDERVDLSLASGLHATDSSCDTQPDIKIDDNDVASNGLSMMAREVHSDGTTIDVRGQRSNIFHSECKVHDKVCKLIIDGGSFTNVISSDLVHALSLSTWRLPSPCYMQWMNQSGTLKITHRARVKFSIGNYMDTVDCAVAPMNACHLLLGRPWQFDVDATHGGRSNNYSFVHKGVHHVLKPMPESAIKAIIFPHVKVKKKVAEIVPKSRTTLLQGTENDVNIPTLAAASESVIHDKSAKKISDINPQFNESSDIAIMGNSSVIINYLGESCDANKSPIQFGSFSNFVGHHSKKDENIIDTKMKKPVELIPKPRTALFQGGEVDESMAPQIIAACVDKKKCNNSKNSDGNDVKNLSVIKLGAFCFDVNQNIMKKGFLSSTASIARKVIFGGANNLRKKKEIQSGGIIHIVGSVHVEINQT